ncbi:MAG: Obg family GTPase CgtA [Patescibacteria group bacterium]|nr:Obg family GTPase CgtA [Patescibacteria group bacterium]
MLVDEVEIQVQAGKGGNGKVNFHREKYVQKGGPDGGDGGNGGDIYFEAVENIGALGRFRHQKGFKAEDGQPGGKNRKTGASGKDLVLLAPVGTVIKDIGSGEMWEIRPAFAKATAGEEKILIAKGGKGGRGNWHFKSATHQTPMEFEEGAPGKERSLFLELRLIADIAFIGYPSVGKSSLLNELTAALVKTAAYHFTTLEPNLGAMDGLILADLPGLIEGASTGKGLGIKFLKHIKRTKALVHVISAESDNPFYDYEVIRKELGEYDQELLEKPEIIVVNKSDMVTREKIEEILKQLKKTKREILVTSIHDWESIQKLKKRLKGL